VKPPIESVDDFKLALFQARVIVYADPNRGGAAGIHIAGVIDKLGLAEQLKPRTKYGAGGDVTEVTLAQGNGALGMTQISEIVEKEGAEFVDPLPKELQNYTGVSAGIPTGMPQSESVTAFLKFVRIRQRLLSSKQKAWRWSCVILPLFSDCGSLASLWPSSFRKLLLKCGDSQIRLRTALKTSPIVRSTPAHTKAEIKFAI
jgi:Bacterial extracellular solute-binding protein